MTENGGKKSKSIKDLIDFGSSIAGSAGGATIGFLVGGPPGAIIGSVAGPALGSTMKKIGNEIANRLLGKREQERIGAVIIFAAKKIDENIMNGMEIRKDDFFDDQPNERASAKEIVEGILLSAQREHQERKLPFYSNLLANIVFHPEIDRAQANLLIRTGELLSYRQLCLLTLFVRKNDFNLKTEDYRGTKNLGTEKMALLQEIYDLYLQGMLNCSGEALLGLTDVNPAKMNIQGVGAMLYNLMELGKIEVIEVNGIAKFLEKSST